MHAEHLWDLWEKEGKRIKIKNLFVVQSGKSPYTKTIYVIQMNSTVSDSIDSNHIAVAP